MSLRINVENDTDLVIRNLRRGYERTPVNDAVLLATIVYRKEDTEHLITGATNASPIVITSAAHGLSNGDMVLVRFLEGNTAANRQVWTVANKTDNMFELSGSTGNGTWTANGEWWLVVSGANEISCSYQASTDGDYRGVLPGSLPLRLGTRYNCYVRDDNLYVEDFARFMDVTIGEAVS